MNIIMIGLAKELPEHDEAYELHRLLGALLSRELTVDEKLDIIGKEYDIPLEENFRKDMSTMCNLSQGVAEEAMQKGLEQGRQEGIEQGRTYALIELVNDGVLTIEKAAEKAGMSVKEFKNAMKSANTQSRE